MSYPIKQRMLTSTHKSIPFKHIVIIANFIKKSGVKAIKQTDLEPLTSKLEKTKYNSYCKEKAELAELLIYKIKNYSS